MNNLISIIVPVYNGEKTLRKTIKNILDSTYKNLEIILVDDGSTDASPTICDELKNSYENVTVIHQNNKGAAAARNTGIKESHGEFISFIDCDDFIYPDYFTVLLKNILDTNSDISVVSYVKGSAKDFNKELSPEKKESNIKVYSKKEALSNLLYQRNFISSPWGMLSKKALWNSLSFPEGTRAEDMGTIYRLFYNASKVVLDTKQLYYYVQDLSSTIYTTQNKLNPDYLMHCEDMVAFIEKNIKEILPAAKSRLFSACFQILSETEKNSENANLLNKIYKIIKNIRLDILKDKMGKPRNRIAALLSVVSISMLHKILRLYYKLKLKKM